ncbi:hypothetical protein BH23ACT10_BH23ACT10_13520 [soil metagenome]
MSQEPWPDASVRQERAIRGTAMLFCLIVAATMFASLTALTARGADYDCGPAAFALFAGPDAQTTDVADCGRAAGQRLTTVGGLIVLAMLGATLGPRLLTTPEPPRAIEPPYDLLPSDRVPRAHSSRRQRPFSDATN